MNSLSFSLGGSSSKPSQRRSSPPAKRSNGTKRDHAALLDDASDDEDASTAKRQTITHFDTAAGGAVDSKAPKKEEKKPLVISALANRDWREASKRQRAQRYGITSEQLDARKENAQGDAQGVDKVVKETDAVKYGLNVFAPTAAVLEEDTPMDQEADQQEENAVKKTADQLAIDALTGAAPTSTLTIPAAAAATEEDAFADSFHSAPPAPSLSDYAAVPVEEYGAAMLRGMGWKGPSTTPSLPTKNGKKPLPPPKRPALLGIGADPNAAAQAEELGAWGKTSSSRANGRKEPTMFIPVSMKNKKTGETLTEDELKEKIRRDKEEAENQRFVVSDLEIRDKKRDRRDDGDRDRRRKDEYSDEEERRRRRRDRERDSDHHDKSRNYDRKDRQDRQDRKERDRDSRRERSRDREGKRDRDRDHDKSSSRRDRSRDRDHDHKTRDRDNEKSSSRRERYDDDRSERRRRDRDGGGDGGSYRSSRR
ncbi:hypothetical protein D6C91_07783 [Aureobasidium pullulans]|uniref:Pre-mRNA-splicing factor n=1 Tax=Aureobasidium pullulans TaxID=5580 RepID=A0A4S9SP71_AURPU|nr:hypothetical protein D6C91_07783 [Aureobasidium pullulans]